MREWTPFRELESLDGRLVGHAVSLDLLAKKGGGHLLGAAVRQANVPRLHMHAGCPAGRVVQGDFQDALLHWQAVGKIAVARQKHLRFVFLGIKGNEVTDVAVANLSEVGGRLAIVAGASENLGVEQYSGVLERAVSRRRRAASG
jgi:hypothetical protein